MITVEKPNTVKSAGIQNSVSFGIKQEGLAHIFNVLRNQLYSDKILAVIREYSCNAVDANVEAGCPNEPITVTLPNKLEPMFKVRDNGLGLSDKDIQEIYAFYGESTKRNSNALIGQLGLGSKSAFAYGDNYVINSFVDGVKTSYNAFIDASQIGQIAKLFSEATTEPNGVEICIPVKDRDVFTFKEKAEALFQHFKVRPTVKGQTLEYTKEESILNGDFWKVLCGGNYGYSNPVAIMGNIGYDIDVNSIQDFNTKFSSFNMSGVEINFDIGELEVSASRESLQYTERTQKALIAKMEKVRKEMIAELTKIIGNCSSMIEAKKLYGDFTDYGSKFYRLNGLISHAVMYKGVAVTNNEITFGSNSYTPNPNVVVQLCKKTRTGSNFSRKVSCRELACGNTVFVWNDDNRKSKINDYLWDMVMVDKKRVYLLTFADAAARKVWMDREGFVDADFVKISSLKATTVARIQNGVARTGTTNTKHSTQTFIYNGKKNYMSCNSNYWDAARVDTNKESGVYVEIDGFKVAMRNRGAGVTWDSPMYLNRIESLAVFGIQLPKVYGFKKDAVEKVKKSKNWKSLWAYVDEKVNEFITVNKLAQAMADKQEQHRNENSVHYIDCTKVKGVDSNETFGAYTTAYKECFGKDSKRTEKIVEYLEKIENFNIGVKLPAPTHDLTSMAAKVMAKYPILSIVNFSITDFKVVADYINLIDKTS